MCKECNETDIITIRKKEHIELRCKRGHVWYEDYVDNGGSHPRPKSYKIGLEDTLFKSEKALYKRVLQEIGRDSDFYASADPVEKTKLLIQNCNTNEKDLYQLMKKITDFTT